MGEVSIDRIKREIEDLWAEHRYWLKEAEDAARWDTRDGGHGQYDAAMTRKYAAERLTKLLEEVNPDE